MKALTWHGKSDIRCETVPDPKIEHPRDAIIKVTACAICGSDLHIFNGVMPGMKSGDVSATRRWARSWRSARRTRR
jgi:threonine dehydrogenase-like Zn-dependent dehydrogenase